MKNQIFSALAVSALALAVIALPAGQAAAATQTTVVKKHVRHHVRTARRYVPQHQIACTPAGCNPIPYNCHPVTGYDWWGNPTGYDAIACR